MHNNLLESFLLEKNFEFKKTFKEIYNLKNDVKIFNWNNIKLNEKEFNVLEKITNLKLKGKDITFDIGYRYFRGNKITLKKGVFVPQYDTEQIVDLVLDLDIKKGNILEIGSGSGAISISLEKETDFDITSIDINLLATKLSLFNDKSGKIDFINKDFETFNPPFKFDIIISNPPYIKENDIEVEEWVKNNQPYESLYAGEDGLSFYRTIFFNVKKYLHKNTYIILEIGYSQALDVINLASKISKEIKVIKDYSGLDRFVVIKYE